jgi:hypothetical protein
MKCNSKLFNQILETRSMTVIQHQIEEEMTGPLDLIERIERHDLEAFKKILRTNSLDEVWLICHERLTEYHMDQFRILKEWLNKKKTS